MRQAFERAPASAPLYDFFAQNTCHALSLKPAGKDVFARHVVQLSCSDEVMAHCVLALGGVHLNWNNQADWQTQCSVSAHYSFVLAGLRKDAGAVRKADAVQCLEVAFKILTVCHIEAMSGSTTGGLSAHLRAARQLILAVEDPAPEALRASRPGDMRCLVREVYAYLALVSNITPLGLGPSRHLPLDRLTVNLDRLEDTETYGCVLGCGHDVFECIREVAGFARTRLDEGNRRELCSTRSKSRYRTLLRRIGELRASDPPAIWDPAQARLARLARDMYCGSLRIFLETGMCGAVVDDPCALGTIQSCVDEYVANDAIVSTTAWGTIAVWPMMIAGSCMLKRAQQAKVCHDIWNTPLWRVNHVLTAERILKLLWLSEDKRVFGPFGLYLIMERHGIDMPMA